MEKQGRMNGRVLLTGGTGFVGRAVWERWRKAEGPALRLLVHENAPPPPTPPRCELIRGDLAHPDSLKGICDGVDTVLHLAAYVKDDPELCDTVNARGTEALVEQARAAGVRRLIYLSSAAVYGYAVHRNAKETEAAVRPSTAISRARVRAERAILENGGIVLRPMFTYGLGDTHFLPVIIKTVDQFSFLINGGKARLSVIAVEDLAAILLELAASDWTEAHRGAFHVNDGHPVSLREIVTALARCVGSRRPPLSVPFFIARILAGRPGMRNIQKAGRDSIRHRLFLVSKDHYYDASKLWDLVSVKPGPPFPERLPLYADWYRRFVKTIPPVGRT